MTSGSALAASARRGESPEECLLWEAWEETGLTLTDFRYCGLVTFVSIPGRGSICTCSRRRASPETSGPVTREICSGWTGSFGSAPQMGGDRIFLDLMWKKVPFFLPEAVLHRRAPDHAALNGKPLRV